MRIYHFDFTVLTGDASCVADTLQVQDVVELGLLTSGASRMLFGDRQVCLYPGRVHAHWGAVPHTATWMAPDTRFTVVCVPLAIFLDWNLPAPFVDAILRGTHLQEQEQSAAREQLDRLLFQHWLADWQSADPDRQRLCQAEVRNRLERLAQSYVPTAAQSQSPPLATTATSSQPPELLHRIIRFVGGHHHTPIQVSDVARAVGMSTDHVSRVFAKTWGSSLSSYISRHRVLNAQRLLANSALGIKQIAEESGFGSTRQFFAVFRATTGMTPTRYRKDRAAHG